MSIAAANKILGDMWRDIEQAELKAAAERDRANKNYSSTVFEHGMRWQYWSLKKAGSFVEKRFCYTTTANACGCYLSFTETRKGKRKIRMQRDNIAPHDTRREAKAWALKLYQEYKNPNVEPIKYHIS